MIENPELLFVQGKYTRNTFYSTNPTPFAFWI